MRRLLRWTLIAGVAAMVAGLALLAFVQPLHLRNFATVGDVGVAYFQDHPRLLLNTDRIKARLDAIGVRWAWRAVRGYGPNFNYALEGPFDRLAPVESEAERLALPSTQVIPGLLSAPSAETTSYPLDQGQFEQWTRSHGDIYSSHYSAHDQIAAANVADLTLAWELDTSVGGGPTAPRDMNVQTNPIFAEGLLFATTAEWSIVAVRGDTGELVWEFGAPQQPARRGILYWAGNDEHASRIYAQIEGDIVALDAKSGRRVRSFGDEGYVFTGLSRVAPLIHDGVLIVATMVDAKIVGLDVATGERLWEVAVHPDERRQPGTWFAGGNVWGGMSLDPDRDLVFVGTGDSEPKLYGVSRHGDNLNNASVVAIDIARGEVAWAFQEVRHDLWDFDIPSPPELTTISIGGQDIDVVVAFSKIGNTIVLERATGQPVFDFHLSRTPTSTVPGERTSPYQPDLSAPEPLIELAFSRDDITNVDPEATAFVEFQLENARYGWFEPPGVGESVVTFGVHGGAEWPGAAIDHRRGVAYVPVNRAPWKLKMLLVPTENVTLEDDPRSRLYRDQCQSCHGVDRVGRYETVRSADVDFVPSLNGISFRSSAPRFFQADYFRHRHQYADADLSASQDDLDALWEFFAAWDAAVETSVGFQVVIQWAELTDHEGRPGSRPPWGSIVAIDLATGEHLWETPNGQVEIDGEMRNVGASNFGGAMVTAGDVLFVTGTADRFVRALDSRTGELLWEHRMDAAGSAPPTTYMMDGVQYVSVVSTGGEFHNYPERASKIYTFRLPETD